MSEQMQVDFEKWAKDKYVLDVSKFGHYMAVSTQNAFECWIASRQALVVELPAKPKYGASVFHIADVESALDKAGVPYNV